MMVLLDLFFNCPSMKEDVLKRFLCPALQISDYWTNEQITVFQESPNGRRKRSPESNLSLQKAFHTIKAVCRQPCRSVELRNDESMDGGLLIDVHTVSSRWTRFPHQDPTTDLWLPPDLCYSSQCSPNVTLSFFYVSLLTVSLLVRLHTVPG